MDMTEEQRYMMEGVDAFMQRLEYSFEKDKKTLEKLRQICEQTYYDIAFYEVDDYDENLFNVFNIRTTEDEKQELSDKLFQFHDDYENNFLTILILKMMKRWTIFYIGTRDFMS